MNGKLATYMRHRPVQHTSRLRLGTSKGCALSALKTLLKAKSVEQSDCTMSYNKAMPFWWPCPEVRCGGVALVLAQVLSSNYNSSSQRRPHLCFARYLYPECLCALSSSLSIFGLHVVNSGHAGGYCGPAFSDVWDGCGSGR